jgi:hypothetical protein
MTQEVTSVAPEVMTVTRTLQASCAQLADVQAICRHMALVRADIWRRYGALACLGKRAADIRKDITARCWYTQLQVDGTIRSETTKDVVNDLLTYKAAATQKVRQSIARRTPDAQERKRLFNLLMQDQWLQDPYLHRMMRKHFRHGVSNCTNQFIVRSDKHQSFIADGKLVVRIQIAPKFGSHIDLITTSSGKNVKLKNRNLRVVLNGDVVQIHYATTKAPGRPAGAGQLGIDKGYTEAFVDSDGQAHGCSFGRVLSAFSDTQSATGKQRNRLHALEKAHRAAGRIAKADRIQACNLGCVKRDARRSRAQQVLRTIAYQSAHTVVDKAGFVVSEDLSSPISSSKVQWRQYNRRMSGWAKGVLAQSLEEVCKQRGAVHSTVNAAYTSQMDSQTGLLQGKRVGDKFYRVSGDVIQADTNAARNVLARFSDPDISRWTPYRDVRRILLSRSSGATERQEAPVGRATKRPSRQRSADKSVLINSG